jgi:hypothetical protein
MLWLIWIALMLLTPVVAGVSVWYELHKRVEENVVSDLPNGQAQELS